MAVELIPPQLSNPHAHPHAPIPYTGSPLLLCLADIRLFISLAWSIPGTLIPVITWQSGALDELYPSLPNLFCLFLHVFLLILQSIFLLSIPFLIIFPVWTVILYLLAIYATTFAVAFLLNGTEDVLHSTVNLGQDANKHEGECWIYLNGVSVGKHWLQSNLNRLALTFRRPVTGVHNRTYGILFDLLQCILERDFLYATTDIRRSYVTIKASVLDPKHKKVVLILHSQGGIEGGMILDWLLTELPHDTLSKLEIYTFGSAANHFNNPPRHQNCTAQGAKSNSYAVRHIEHYASTGEFVARWGVLHFARMPNRYAGRVFMRPGTGHLLNQHYLNTMFPLEAEVRDRETGGFMDMRVEVMGERTGEVEEGYVGVLFGDGDGDERDGVGILGGRGGVMRNARVRDYSRLWLYKDGRVPED